jgi:hypothetical protein
VVKNFTRLRNYLQQEMSPRLKMGFECAIILHLKNAPQHCNTDRVLIFVEMRFLNQHTLAVRMICFILVFAIMNISIDPPDLLQNLDADMALEEDISINEMESISELVMEKVLDIDNAIPESDEAEAETLLKKVEVFQHLYEFSVPALTVQLVSSCESLSLVPVFSPQNHSSIIAPPPKV